MQPQAKQFNTSVGNRTVTFETGKLAGQAGGAVTVRLGDSVVFAAATMGEPREGIDFFPLTVEYEERMYAGGRIPGSFFRREGKPSDEAILTARLTDRPLRPLFPEGMRNEVQVILFSLSADSDNPLDILAVNAASAALMISDIPWGGPVGAVRIGRINGNLVVNPTYAEMAESDLDLRIAGTRDAILMVECGASEVPEEVMVEALSFGHKALQPLVELQERMAAEVGKPKREVVLTEVDAELEARVYQRVVNRLNEILDQYHTKNELNTAVDAFAEEVVAEFVGETADENLAANVKAAFEKAFKKIVRQRILEQGKRPDGRTPKEIRPIWCEVGISPRAHGSGLFTRGETQVLTLATLGTPKEAQELDSLTPVETKRYMHHYNFPPYSTGEVKPLRGQSRREIGHGALAERALLPVIPPEVEFPYTLRLVSEVLSSNGSTSMASVCGSTLALMDTGVPIKAPVAGVAMGLIKEGERYAILTDIQGMEDHLGDMDFKVAGSSEGITALQMDIKIEGVTFEILKQALQQARAARLFILDQMLAVLPEPRAELSPYAPRIITMQIHPDQIGLVIGKGGETIKGMVEEFGVTIDIEDDGTVFICAPDMLTAESVTQRIQSMTKDVEVGDIITGKVVKTTAFGAFVELKKGVDGLIHISKLGKGRVERVEDVLNRGDVVTVEVVEVDPERGRIGLKPVGPLPSHDK